MFTGIIQATGKIKAITPLGGDIRLAVCSPALGLDDVALGDSIASNGICLTVVQIDGQSYAVDVSRETMDKTTLTRWQVGDVVNLEKAMLPTTRFGGHIVAGHVDGVGTIQKMTKDARSLYVEVVLAEELMKYTANKGSITVDGISLTINDTRPHERVVCLNIIPHTAKVTNIDQQWQVGGVVNVEVDLLARYLERLLLDKEGKQSLTEATLIESGFGR